LKRVSQDLDVALPLGARQTPQDGLKVIRDWSARNGLQFVRQNPKGPLTLEVFFSTPSGIQFPVEVSEILAALNASAAVDCVSRLLTARAGLELRASSWISTSTI
jgi:hypothetical protein